MSTLSLHLAIHTANIEIRKATKASDDYLHASTETLFNTLWDIAPQVEYCDDLWNVALGGDVSGSWIAKVVDERAPQHKMLLLSSCNKSKVIAYSADHSLYGDWRSANGVKTFRTLNTLGDDLRQIIQSVIREGDFYGDDQLFISPPGIKLPPRPPKLTEKDIDDAINDPDAKTFAELPTPDEWIAKLSEFLSKQPGQGRAEDVDLATFKEPIKEGFIPGEPVGRSESGTLSLTGVCRQLSDLDPERRKEIIDNILGSKPGVHRTVGQRWQPIGGKELAKNLREYQEEQRSRLPRDTEGNVADFVPDDSPTR